MKEINGIVAAYREMEEGNSAAMATLVRLEGSSYRRLGARMLVFDDGRYVGGISGGCLEGDALRRAQKSIMQQKASLITYDTTRSDGQQIGIGLGCNGIIDVMFSPVTTEVINSLDQVRSSRAPQVILTITDGANLGWSSVYDTGMELPTGIDAKEVQAAVQMASDSRRSAVITSGGQRLFVEVVLPQTHLAIYGGHHDVLPLVKLAAELGWKTTVVMNLLKAEKALYSYATEMMDRNSAEQPLTDAFTAIVLMSHDYKTDKQNLQRLTGTKAFYIGVLGPRNRTERMYAEFEAAGVQAPTANIFSPAGLDIGATTPEEIALSIVAEIRACSAGRKGSHLREREGTIYGR